MMEGLDPRLLSRLDELGRRVDDAKGCDNPSEFFWDTVERMETVVKELQEFKPC